MKSVVVSSCRHCPFLTLHPLQQGLFALFVPIRSGTCAFDKDRGYDGMLELGLPPGRERDETMEKVHRRNARTIDDIDKVPPTCPLLDGPVSVAISS